jgi:Tfp pilus assembly protein PilO
VTRSTRILVAVAAIGLAAAAFYFLMLAPKRDEVAKLDTDIASKQAEIAQSQQMLATYEAAKASYKGNYATLARLGKAVPADDDVRSLLVQIEASADRTGVDFKQIELGSNLAGADSTSATAGQTPESATTTGTLASAPGAVPVAGGALSAMPFNFTFTGGFFDLSTFFAKLEHFVTVNNQNIDATGRLLRLESVSITPSTTGFPSMDAAVGAAAYIVPPVEGVKDASAASSAATENASTTPSTPSSPGSTPTTTATAGAAQ